MFLTVFLAALLAAYIMGSLVCLGVSIVILSTTGWDRDNIKIAIVAILMSWIAVGMKLCDHDDNITFAALKDIEH